MFRLVFVFLFFVSSETDARECKFVKKCKEVQKTFKDASKSFIFEDSDKRIPSLNERASACTSISNCDFKDIKRIERLKKISKDSLTSAIQKGRPIDSLGRHEKTLIKIISKVKVHTSSSDKQCRAFCDAEGSFASAYGGSEDGVCICPQIENFPEETIISSIAHEIGHHLSYCDENLISGTKDIPAIPQEQHPFLVGQKSSRSCLIKAGITDGNQTSGLQQFTGRYKLFFRKIDSAQKRMIYDWTDGQSKGTPVNRLGFNVIGSLIIGTSANLWAIGSYNKDCNGPLTGSQMDEAQADFFGAEAMVEYYKKYPPKGKDAHFLPLAIALFLVKNCEESGLRPNNSWLHYSKSLYFWHPSPRDRAESIFFRNPGIRKIFGCKDQVPILCGYNPQLKEKFEVTKEKVPDASN